VSRVFFPSILLFNQSVNDPQKDLAKFGYKLNIEILGEKNLKKTLLDFFWLPTLTMYRNLVIFLKFRSNSGYLKSQKALDFSTFMF
jgi:hypothetical protein